MGDDPNTYWNNGQRFASGSNGGPDLDEVARQNGYGSAADWQNQDPEGYSAYVSTHEGAGGSGDTQVANSDDLDTMKLALLLGGEFGMGFLPAAAPGVFGEAGAAGAEAAAGGGAAGAGAAGAAGAGEAGADIGGLAGGNIAAAGGGGGGVGSFFGAQGVVPTIVSAVGGAASAYSNSKNRQAEIDLEKQRLAQQEADSQRQTATVESGRDPFRQQVQQGKDAAKLDLLARMNFTRPGLNVPGRYASAVPDTMRAPSYIEDPAVQSGAATLRDNVLAGKSAPTMTNPANFGKTAALTLPGGSPVPATPPAAGAIAPSADPNSDEIDPTDDTLTRFQKIRKKIQAPA